MKFKEKFNITRYDAPHTVFVVPYYENWESSVGTKVILDGNTYTIKEVERTRTSAIPQPEEDWKYRDVWILVDRIN